MLIFEYTCSKSRLRRANVLIFHYTQSKDTFWEGEAYFIARVVKVTSSKPAGATLQEELQNSKTNLDFCCLFSHVFIKKIRFSGSGAPGVLLGGPRAEP